MRWAVRLQSIERILEHRDRQHLFERIVIAMRSSACVRLVRFLSGLAASGVRAFSASKVTLTQILGARHTEDANSD
jgi:hypothetical protein